MTLVDFMYMQGGGATGGPGMSSVPSHGHPERQWERKRKGGEDKGGVDATHPGGSGTGSSKTSQECIVYDTVGRRLSTHTTLEEASRAQAARRYTKVRCRIPVDKTPKVRDKARRRMIKREGPFDRRTMPFPDYVSAF